MDIIARRSRGHNVVGRAQARPRFYAPAEAAVQLVEVWWKYEGAPTSSAQLIGVFRPGEAVDFPFTPTEDRNIILLTRSISADGTPSIISLDDAVQATVLVQRETSTPVIGQMGDATTESVTVGVSNYSSFARRRRVKIATALDGGGALISPATTVFDSSPDSPPPYVDFMRGTGPQTIYVAVAHSSGEGTVWTADSNILTLTFASSEGTGGGGGSGSGEPTGGTSGDFDPTRRDSYTLA